MSDPFRPNSNAQLVREAQMAFVVIGALLCVLVYVGFQKLTGRKIHFQEMAQSAPVAEHIDGTQYTAQAMLSRDDPPVQTFIDRIKQINASKKDQPKKDSAVAKANFLTPLSAGKKLPRSTQSSADDHDANFVVSASRETDNDNPFATIQSNPDFSKAFFTPSKKPTSKPIPKPTSKPTPRSSAAPSAEHSHTDFIPTAKPLPEIKSNFGQGRDDDSSSFNTATGSNSIGSVATEPINRSATNGPKAKTPRLTPARPITDRARLGSAQFEQPRSDSSLADSSLADFSLADSAPFNSALTDSNSNDSNSNDSDSNDSASFQPNRKSDRKPDSTTVAASSDLQPKTAAPLKKLRSFLDPRPDTAAAQRVAANDDTEHRDVIADDFDAPTPQDSDRSSSEQQHQTIAEDSLWSIAADHYGDGRFFRALYQHNRDRIPDAQRLEPGIVLMMPTIDDLIQHYPQLCPADIVRQSQQTPDGDGAKYQEYVQYETKMQDRYHVTGPGDTLFNVARQRLGQASRYLEIFELNQFRIPKNITHLTPLKPGLRLLLPE